MLIDRLPHLGTTIFSTMSALAQQHGAINLGQGFPDFPMPALLVEAVAVAMRQGHNQYAPANGLPVLRQRIAEKAAALYSAALDAEAEITITPGGTYALYTAITAAVQPGDEVIFFEPAYDCYLPQIQLAGGVPVPIPLEHPTYRIDWDEVRRAITPRTAAIIINSPHNPTGTVLTEVDMRELESIVADSRIVVISDEVYEHIIFDGLPHLSALRYPALYERAFVCFSFGKTYHCTGWKLGYCIAPPAFTALFRKIHQFNAFTCDTPKQVGLAQVITDASMYRELGGFLQAKRDRFLALMQGTGFEPLPSHGSYFQLYDYSSLSDKGEKDFAVWLTEKAGVATIPVSAFYSRPVDRGVVRFCFAKKEETLEAAAEKLREYFG